MKGQFTVNALQVHRAPDHCKAERPPSPHCVLPPPPFPLSRLLLPAPPPLLSSHDFQLSLIFADSTAELSEISDIIPVIRRHRAVAACQPYAWYALHYEFEAKLAIWFA